MSEENVETARRVMEFLGELGRQIESGEAAERLSDPVLSEFADPEIELIPLAQGLLSGNTYKGYEGMRRFWGHMIERWGEPASIDYWAPQSSIGLRPATSAISAAVACYTLARVCWPRRFHLARQRSCL